MHFSILKRVLPAIFFSSSAIILTACGSGDGSNTMDTGVPSTGAATSGENNQSSGDSQSSGPAPASPDSANAQSSSIPKPEFVAGPVACETSGDDFRNRMLYLVNDMRASPRMCGTKNLPAAAPVTWSNELQIAAEIHSQDMASSNFVSHTGSNGLSEVDRVKQNGNDTNLVAENVAAGRTEMQMAISDWTNSELHCSNIMNADYSEIGAACVSNPGSDFTHYWTLVLITP